MRRASKMDRIIAASEQVIKSGIGNLQIVGSGIGTLQILAKNLQEENRALRLAPGIIQADGKDAESSGTWTTTKKLVKNLERKCQCCVKLEIEIRNITSEL
jgi:hypothetical protein